MAALDVLSLVNTPADPRTGSGYVIVRGAQELRRRGHEVRVIDPSGYEPLPRLARARQYKQAVGMALRALREVRSRRPDVVELWGGESWLAALRLRRRFRGRVLVVARSNGIEPHCAEHMERAREAGEIPPRPWYQLDQTRLFETAFRSVDAIVTVGEFDREFALRRGYLGPGRVIAVPNPLPSAYLGLDSGGEREKAIGFCGSWIPRKGTALLRAAMPAVLREHAGWRFVLIGVGAGFKPADHFPPDVLDRVVVVPHAEREEDLISIYRSLSVLVMPSIYESFGLVATEAMACGTPVVATRTGIAASLAPDHEVFELADRDPSTFVATLRRVIENPERRAAVGRAGRLRVQTLRWPEAARRLESSYLRWLEEVRRP